jgi:hypothetical protein
MISKKSMKILSILIVLAFASVAVLAVTQYSNVFRKDTEVIGYPIQLDVTNKTVPGYLPWGEAYPLSPGQAQLGETYGATLNISTTQDIEFVLRYDVEGPVTAMTDIIIFVLFNDQWWSFNVNPDGSGGVFSFAIAMEANTYIEMPMTIQFNKLGSFEVDIYCTDDTTGTDLMA